MLRKASASLSDLNGTKRVGIVEAAEGARFVDDRLLLASLFVSSLLHSSSPLCLTLRCTVLAPGQGTFRDLLARVGEEFFRGVPVGGDSCAL